jgi:hypothetical protein
MRVLVLMAALLVFGPASAAAETVTYRGKTSQGLKTVVKVKDGKVQTVNVPWKTRRCRPRGYMLSYPRFIYTNSSADPIEQDGSRFSDGGRVTVPHRNGSGKARLNVHLRGRIAGNSMSGTQTISARTRDNLGRHTCKSHVRWHATLVTASAAQAPPADGTYRGRTSQGYKTVAKVKDGVLQSVNVPWLGHCKDKGWVWGPMTRFSWTNTPDGPIEHSGNEFSDGGRIPWHQPGERAVIKARLKGRLSGNRISGTQRTTVRVLRSRHGRDYCKAKVRWSATLVGG